MLPRPGQDVPEQTGGHQIRAPWSLDQIAPNSLGSLLPGMPRLMVLTPEVETSEKNSPAQGPLAGTSFTTIVTLVPSRSCVTLSTHDPLWIVPPETNSTPGRRSLTVTLRADPYFKRALCRMQAARISATTMTTACSARVSHALPSRLTTMRQFTIPIATAACQTDLLLPAGLISNET